MAGSHSDVVVRVGRIGSTVVWSPTFIPELLAFRCCAVALGPVFRLGDSRSQMRSPLHPQLES
jgi:hypothetical protein